MMLGAEFFRRARRSTADVARSCMKQFHVVRVAGHHISNASGRVARHADLDKSTAANEVDPRLCFASRPMVLLTRVIWRARRYAASLTYGRPGASLSRGRSEALGVKRPHASNAGAPGSSPRRASPWTERLDTPRMRAAAADRMRPGVAMKMSAGSSVCIASLCPMIPATYKTVFQFICAATSLANLLAFYDKVIPV